MDWHGYRVDLYCSGGCDARVIVDLHRFETKPYLEILSTFESRYIYLFLFRASTYLFFSTTRETPGIARTLFIFYSARHTSATLYLLHFLTVFCSGFLPILFILFFLHPWPCVLAWDRIFELPFFFYCIPQHANVLLYVLGTVGSIELHVVCMLYMIPFVSADSPVCTEYMAFT